MGRRRVRFALAISLSAAIGAAAGVAVYRVPIFETLITTALRAKGVPAPRISVSDVGWNSLGLAGLSLGTASEVSARSIRLDYELSGLLTGRLEQVAVDGLAITLDLTGDAPLLGSLQPLLSGGDSSGRGTGPLPPLSLTDLRIDVQTPVGVVRAIGGGQIRTEDDGGTAVEMTLQEIALDGRAIASGRFAVDVSVARTTGTAEFLVTDLTLPENIAGLNGSVRLSIDAAEGVVSLGLREDANLSAAQVSPVFLQSFGIPTETANQITQGFAARLQSPAPFAVISRDAAALDGTLYLTVPGLVDLSLTLPVDIRVDGGKLREPAELRLAELRYGEIGELLEPTVISVAEAEVTSDLDYRVALSGPVFRLKSRDVEATISPGWITLSPGRIKIATAQIEIPAYRIAAEGVSAIVETTDVETRIGYEVSSVRQTGPEAMVVPLTITGQVARKGDVWQGTAIGIGPGGVGRVSANGSHDGASARGQAHVVLEPLVFAPGGAQPGAVLPLLSALQAVSGTATGNADLSWSAQGFQSSGTLMLKDIGFDSPQARVEGLDVLLTLDSLAPLASPPRQTLTIRRLEPGLPLDRLDIRFQIRPTVPPSVAIEAGEVFLGSGRFSLNDLIVDPAAPRQDVDLRVQDLSLAELFAILNIDGLDGDGQLSGTIPITFSPETLIIENGRLATSAPGVIRFRSEKAAEILAGQGESLDLVLRALEDFRYEKLTIELEKLADDVGRMKLSLLGKNPTVLEGYPFQFNISIEANMAKLVTALTAIYQVPNDFLRRAWTSGR